MVRMTYLCSGLSRRLGLGRHRPLQLNWKAGIFSESQAAVRFGSEEGGMQEREGDVGVGWERGRARKAETTDRL